MIDERTLGDRPASKQGGLCPREEKGKNPSYEKVLLVLNLEDVFIEVNALMGLVKWIFPRVTM